eukprot:TRINITY_DN3183_c0_g1_i1.p1 TRINITY_DN3183_c0_g1~~TRINITY_DN3183_c0_g1_i1.p1  ORF type:complete len:397 (-),score=35.19 TRINITY_DN3183_c0_g1_i1:10-1200(-)
MASLHYQSCIIIPNNNTPLQLVNQCCNITKEVLNLILNTKDNQQLPSLSVFQDLTELKATIGWTQEELQPYSVNVYDNVALCSLEVILASLQSIVSLLQETQKIQGMESWQNIKHQLYKLDFKLKYQVDQFTALYTPSSALSVTDVIAGEGRTFWLQVFGEKLFVPWANFFRNFISYIKDGQYVDFEPVLKKYLDFTFDDEVSVWEISIFLKWFGPLQYCFQNLLDAIHSGLLAGFVPASEATVLLNSNVEGSFLIRFSKTQLGSFAVTFVDSPRQIKHCLLHCVETGGLTLKTPPAVYPNLIKFVEAHSEKLKYPFISTSLKQSLEDLKQIQNKRNQAKLVLRDIDTCVICLDDIRGTVFLNCHHMVCCVTCSSKLEQCPVCRGIIERVVTVYRP